MSDSSKAQRICVHETLLMFVIANKGAAQNIKIMSENATKITRLIAITDIKYVSYTICREIHKMFI